MCCGSGECMYVFNSHVSHKVSLCNHLVVFGVIFHQLLNHLIQTYVKIQSLNMEQKYLVARHFRT